MGLKLFSHSSVGLFIIFLTFATEERSSICKNYLTMNLLMIRTPEIILIVVVVLLLFGGKKIPELMKGLGKGVKSFKEGMNGKDDATEETSKSE